MAGLAWRRELAGEVSLIRPMLAVDHAWAEALCRAAGLTWREDATNRDVSRTRAAIRQRLAPELRALRAGTPERLVEAAQLWRDAAEALEEKSLRLVGESDAWERAQLRGQSVGVLAEGLRLAILRRTDGESADRLALRKLFACAEAVLDASTEPRRFQMTANLEVIVRNDLVVLHTIDESESCGDKT